MATSPPPTSTRQQGHSDRSTQTPWVTGSSYHRSPRCFGQIHLRSDQTHQDQVYYSAYNKDIAIVNIFFGEPTVFGESQYYFYQWYNMFPRVREVAKDDLVGLHLRLRRSLWTLPWDELCVSCWDSLLVFYQAFDKLWVENMKRYLLYVMYTCSMYKCITFCLIYWWCLVSWLCLGISFESGAEILYWFAVNLWGQGEFLLECFVVVLILSFETSPFKRPLV